MAVARQLDAQTIGRMYAESVSRLGIVKSVHARETDEGLELWVVTEPTEISAEQSLYKAGITLEDRFPDAGIMIHIVNPLDYPNGHNLLAEVIPTQANEAATLR